MSHQQPNEMTAIRVDAAETSTTSAPTLATHGVAVVRSTRQRRRVHLLLQKGAASGTRTLQVKVHGYSTQLSDQAAHPSEALTPVASSGAWYEIFDTGALSDAADFNVSYQLSGGCDYERLATEVVTNGGTTPTLTSGFGFGGIEAA